MFVLTARFSKRNLLFLLLILIAVGALALFLLLGRSGGKKETDEPQLSTNEDRISYLESYGWKVTPEPVETFQLLLPDKLPEPYLAYNELQKKQGFDLTACCGKQVSRYTYAVTNYPGHPDGVQLNLYLCGDKPAAGDIVVTGTDGFQAGLAFPDSK